MLYSYTREFIQIFVQERPIGMLAPWLPISKKAMNAQNAFVMNFALFYFIKAPCDPLAPTVMN
eukprot:scaffold6655_cov169-Amphora_coffeaeformis.AAC.19